MIIRENKLVIIAEPKTIHFDIPKIIDNNMMHESDWFYQKQQIFGWAYNKNRNKPTVVKI